MRYLISLFLFFAFAHTSIASHIYIANWEWFCEDDQCWWRNPGGNSTGALDLRVSTQSRIAGGEPEGYGIFSYTSTQTISGSIYLGNDLNGILTKDDKDSIKSALGLSELDSNTVSEFLWDIRTKYADPMGKTMTKPLMPRMDGTLRLRFGDWIREEKFLLGKHSHTNQVVKVLQEDYRMFRSEFLNKFPVGHSKRDHYKKVLGGFLRQFMTSNYLQFIPSGFPDEGWSWPTTTLGDTFVEGSDTPLASHTATGPNGGFTWTQLTGPITVREATDDARTGDASSARADDTLSSSNMRAEADISSLISATRRIGIAARYSASTVTFYLFSFRDNDTDTWRLGKVIDGTLTEFPFVDEGSAPGTTKMRIEVNGSGLEGFSDDVSKITSNDTEITGHLHAGLHSVNIAGTDRGVWNNFLSADLAAVVGRRRFWVGGAYGR